MLATSPRPPVHRPLAPSRSPRDLPAVPEQARLHERLRPVAPEAAERAAEGLREAQAALGAACAAALRLREEALSHAKRAARFAKARLSYTP